MMNARQSFSRRLKYVPVVLLCLLAGWLINLFLYKPFRLETFMERVFFQYALRHPELMSQTKVFSKLPFLEKENRLDDLSEPGEDALHSFVSRNYEMLMSYRWANYTEQTQLSAEIMAYFMETIIYRRQYPHYQYPIEHLAGPHIRLPVFMRYSHQIHTPGSAEDYISRLSGFGKRYQQLIRNLMLREEFISVPPARVLDEVVGQIDQLLADSTDVAHLLLDYRHKTIALDSTNTQMARELYYKAVAALQDVRAECQELRQKLLLFRPKASDALGIWRYPEGDEYYYYMLRQYLSVEQHRVFSDLTPDSLFLLAKHEADSLKGLMTRQLQSLLPPPPARKATSRRREENTEPDFRTLLQALMTRFKNEEMVSEDVYLARIEAISAELHRGAALLPAIQPHIGPVSLQPMPIWMRSYHHFSEYLPASFGREREAVLLIATDTMRQLPTPFLKVWLAGALFPGVHLQQTAQIENRYLPTFRRYVQFPAYTEGWQLVAMEYALRMGLLPDEPVYTLAVQYFHQLAACRLMADIGIHALQWEEEDVRDLYHNYSALSDAYIELEINNLLAEPGRAAAAFFGQYILSNAVRQSGDFPMPLLQQGNIPMFLLEKHLPWLLQADQHKPVGKWPRAFL